MITRYKLILFVVLLLSFSAFAQKKQHKMSQDFDVRMGEPYPVVDARVKEYISDENGHIITIKSDEKKVTILLYDAENMRQLNEKVYEDFPKDSEVQKTIKAGNKLFYLFSVYNKKSKKTDLYTRPVDMSTGLFDDYTLLFSTSGKVNFSGQLHDRVGTNPYGAPICFLTQHSINGEKLMINYRLKPGRTRDAKNFDVLGFYVFNANTLEQQWGCEVKMPYTEKQMNNIAYGVTNDGNVYMLAEINETHKLELFEINNSLTVKTNPIGIESTFYFNELTLRETPDGNLFFIGFYSEEERKYFTVGRDSRQPLLGSLRKANGIIRFKLNRNAQVLQSTNYEFPVELINQYESKRNQKQNEKKEAKGKLGIEFLNQVQCTLEPDGGITIVGEQQYIFRGTGNPGVANSGASPVTYYCYEDLYMFRFNKDGTLMWNKKLPKQQNGIGRIKGDMSIRYIKGKGIHYLLFADHPSNARLSANQIPVTHVDDNGGILTAYKVNDATGDIEKHLLFDLKSLNGKEIFQFFPSRIFNGSEGVFFTEVYLKNKEDNMIRIKLVK
jgi:hypothetical protein